MCLPQSGAVPVQGPPRRPSSQGLPSLGDGGIYATEWSTAQEGPAGCGHGRRDLPRSRDMALSHPLALH